MALQPAELRKVKRKKKKKKRSGVCSMFISWRREALESQDYAISPGRLLSSMVMDIKITTEKTQPGSCFVWIQGTKSE